ncbi:MAG: type III polyketide synthase, partial [Thermoleophilia bacterium]|nr:type III polyketide synthase [Thermoleophilia bacterium]
DGAAAAVVTAGAERAGLALLGRIAAAGGCVCKDSADAMGWKIGDHGFEMTLSESVPRLIARNLRPWLTAWLDSHDRSLAELVERGDWAVHPGGPRVLDAVAAALDLSERAISPSREVLAEHGNMSSPTVLFILQRLLRGRDGPPPAAPRPTVLLAFGPGLSIEAALLLPA